ncbi:MAG: AMP-binding protein [Alphaproteobacteria bacterium]|nr:AMP-binding protein [Alphaproteobacteria bacterium]
MICGRDQGAFMFRGLGANWFSRRDLIAIERLLGRAMSNALSGFFRRVLPFFLVRFIFRLCFRVDVRGLENFSKAGPRTLIIANHVSRIDALLLSAFLPGQIVFALQAQIAFRWWLKPYWHLGDDFSLDQANPLTAKKIIDALKSGKRCMIFPEGRMTTTGGLMKVYDGPGMIADKADAEILPIRIDGPQYSCFSNAQGLRRRLFPKFTLSILPSQRLSLPPEVKGHKRRKLAATAIYDLLERAMIEGIPYKTLLRQLLDTRAVRGGGNVILEDAARKPISHDRFIAQIFATARALGRAVKADEKCVGVMMPNGIANGTVVFAAQALDRVAAMVNFTSGPARVVQACLMARIQTVISSRAFIEAQHLGPIVEALESENVRIVFMEDLKPSALDRLVGILKALLPVSSAAKGLSSDPDAPALMLFTSGTEGKPKGVMLSHRNIISNGFQTGVRLGFSSRDSGFACLPMFHSFGLSLGFFMPLYYGTKTFLYPSPIRYHDIPELVYDTQATMLLGTDTFLSNYEKHASPHDFYFMRFAIGGAEKIKPETRRAWAEKFGVRLFEGYGTTEASPVITVNSPLHYKAGTIGRAVSGLDVKLEPVEGIRNGAELCIRGINVMLGYVKTENPGVIEKCEGWYKTGDIVSLDEDGFVTILGRTKRFAKVAGEMISLGAIESLVSDVWPGVRHVAVSVPHERKGERIVLLTESDSVDLNALSEKMLSYGLTNLYVPKVVLRVSQIPLLGSGKTDYVSAKELAERELCEEQENMRRAG